MNMSETSPIPASLPDPIRSGGAARPARTAEGARTTLAFEALLERLTARAAELSEKKSAIATPGEVHEAVDAARASLEDALTLGERLLEAYRAAERRNAPETKP
jgi:hypothetical protein